MAPPKLPDKSPTINAPKLLDRMRDELRVKHYSIRTEQAYVDCDQELARIDYPPRFSNGTQSRRAGPA